MHAHAHTLADALTHARTRIRSHTHIYNCSHKDPERLCDCGALDGIEVKDGLQRKQLPARVLQLEAGSTRERSGAEDGLTEQPQEIPRLSFPSLQSGDEEKATASAEEPVTAAYTMLATCEDHPHPPC